MPPETPIIIGVADIKNRTTTPKEPLVLIHEAILAALHDASPSSASLLQSSIDSIAVVKTWTWPYANLPGSIASKLGVEPKHSYYSEHGGDQPGRLFDDAARRVARGECRVAVVAGGEALASLSACAAAGQLPPPGWTPPSQPVHSVFTPTGMDLGSNLGGIHNFGTPVQVYPLYENALRAHTHQSPSANHAQSAKLYAEYAQIASSNEAAWSHGTPPVTEKIISEVGGKNRMICHPYPLLMNAFNGVNLSAAVILTSQSFAAQLPIPREKYIYPLSSAFASSPPFFWKRPNFHTSPSLSASLDTALSLANLSPGEISLFDIYACFPVVPKLAARHLGVELSGKGTSILGGLTSFGGAGNNYSMHALTAMARRLREEGGKGLVLCNGGVVSSQSVVILSNEARNDGTYPVGEEGVLGEVGGAGPEIEERPEGEGVVETYTVEYKRDGSPLRGYIVGRLTKNGRRFLANDGDERTLRQMADRDVEFIGQKGWVEGDKRREGRSLFTLDRGSKI